MLGWDWWPTKATGVLGKGSPNEGDKNDAQQALKPQDLADDTHAEAY